MASKRHLRRKRCQGKRAYDTEEEAILVRNRMRDQLGVPDLMAYRCDFCHHWHVGNMPKNVRLGFDKMDPKWRHG